MCRLAHPGIATLLPARAGGGAARGVHSAALRTGCLAQQLRKCALPLQVVALRLRSSGRVGQAPLPEEQELDYAAKLNKALPHDIKVLGWTTVPEGFSARWAGQHATAHSSWLGHIALVSAEAATEPCLQNFCTAQLLLIFMHNHCKCMAGLLPTKHADEDRQQLLLWGSTIVTCLAEQVFHPAPRV